LNDTQFDFDEEASRNDYRVVLGSCHVCEGLSILVHHVTHGLLDVGGPLPRVTPLPSTCLSRPRVLDIPGEQQLQTPGAAGLYCHVHWGEAGLKQSSYGAIIYASCIMKANHTEQFTIEVFLDASLFNLQAPLALVGNH